jgi:hypothetical protein
MNAPTRLVVTLFLLWLVYAVGAAALDESVQVLAGDGATDLRGILIAGVGGAHAMLLMAAAYAVAAGWLRGSR